MKNLGNITNNQRDEDLKLLFYGILVGIVAGSFSSLYRYIIHGIAILIQKNFYLQKLLEEA